MSNTGICIFGKVTTHCYHGFTSYVKNMIDRYVAQFRVRRCVIYNRNWWNVSCLIVSCNVPDDTLANTLFFCILSPMFVLIFHKLCSTACRHQFVFCLISNRKCEHLTLPRCVKLLYFPVAHKHAPVISYRLQIGLWILYCTPLLCPVPLYFT